MSEYLLLSVYRRYLEANGYEVEQKATIPGGIVDILAKFGDPDKKGKLCDISEWLNTYSSVEDTCYYYGSIRLSVSKDGFIIRVQVDGPAWQKKINDRVTYDKRNTP